MKVLAALAVACLLAAGCGRRVVTVSSEIRPAGPVVPWLDEPAPNVAMPITVPGIAACPASALSAETTSPYPGSGPLNTSFWTVTVRNRGSAECFIGPSLNVVAYTADGALQIPAAQSSGDIVYLPPGAAADGEIDLEGCRYPTITRLDLSPGSTLGKLTVVPGIASGWGTPCPQPRESYFVQLRPVESQQPGYAPAVLTGIQAPAAAERGAHLRFLVTITNESDRWSLGPSSPPPPITFQDCPTYHMEIEGTTGTFRTLRLNCARAKPIPAGASESFEMYVDVPPDAVPGPAALAWAVDGPQPYWGRAAVALEIR